LTRSGFPKRTRRGISSAMRHAYHVPGPAQYYLRRAAILPRPANMTGGAARDALVIRHGHVMTMDPQLGDIPGADVHVDGGRIVAVRPGLHVPGARVLDARGMIVAPGLVDTHWHMWNTLLRSMSGDAPKPGCEPSPSRGCAGGSPTVTPRGTRTTCRWTWAAWPGCTGTGIPAAAGSRWAWPGAAPAAATPPCGCLPPCTGRGS